MPRTLHLQRCFFKYWGNFSLSTVDWCVIHIRHSCSPGDSTQTCRPHKERSWGCCSTPPTVCLSLYAPPLLVQGHPWYILLELLRVVQAFHMVSYNVLYIVVKSSVCGAYWSVVAGKFGSDSDSLSRMNKIVFNCSFQPTAALRRVWWRCCAVDDINVVSSLHTVFIHIVWLTCHKVLSRYDLLCCKGITDMLLKIPMKCNCNAAILLAKLQRHCMHKLV